MKKIMVLIALLMVVAMLAGCAMFKIPEAPKDEGLLKYADPAAVKRMTDSMNENAAKRNGDTYCTKCEKFIESKVRICTYCGKYI